MIFCCESKDRTKIVDSKFVVTLTRCERPFAPALVLLPFGNFEFKSFNDDVQGYN